MADTPADVGLLAEYHYDERGDEATNGLASDIYLGVRLTANDIASRGPVTDHGEPRYTVRRLP